MKIVRRRNKWIEVAHELYDVKSAIKELQLKQKKIQKELIHLSKNTSSQGGGFSFLIHERKGNVNYSMIPELATIDLESYRKDTVLAWLLKKETKEEN